MTWSIDFIFLKIKLPLQTEGGKGCTDASIHKTRMTTFIKTKFNKSDEYLQYRVAANITEYQSNLTKCM